ncbi:MAG: hypothetical protein WAW60_03625 [Candidatus Saccharimonadales bacterium]
MNRDFGGPTRLGMIIIGVVFFLIVAGLFYFITGGGRSADPGVSQEETKRSRVTTINSGRSVRMTVYGPIVADEERESYEVTVTTTSRRFAAYRGYNQTQIAASDYGNTYEGYQQLVYALAHADFDKEKKVDELAKDDRGACATGRLYVYELFENGDLVRRTWTTSCSKVRGDFAGLNRQVAHLFKRQVPDFNNAVKVLKTLRSGNY